MIPREFFLRDARGTFKHLCLLDANGTQLFPLPALFSKDFSLGSSEVFPAATLWFQNFTYSRQQQTCREMAYAVSQVCKGSGQPHRFALRALAQVLSTILGTGSLMLHGVPASGFAGSF